MMTFATVENASLGLSVPHRPERQEQTLAGAVEELTHLRFAIILTVRWEAEEKDNLERRRELRDELEHLRMLYYDQIDEIAMSFGVQDAMNAQRDVERNVIVPVGARLPTADEVDPIF